MLRSPLDSLARRRRASAFRFGVAGLAALGLAAAWGGSPAVARGGVLSLTAPGSLGTINGALFRQIDPRSTGTGVVDAFLRLQANNTERGYNTDGALEFDQKAGNFTHSVKVADVPVVTVRGVHCWELLLDTNQSGGGKSLLSLDELRIFVEDTGNLTGSPSAFTHLAYDLDAGGDNWILLDDGLSTGSGSGDMIAYIPMGSFGADPSKYLYLYSAFGDYVEANGGFEEWAHGVTPITPEPASLFVLALGGTVALLRRRHA